MINYQQLTFKKRKYHYNRPIFSLLHIILPHVLRARVPLQPPETCVWSLLEARC